jgi:hypothetical protein
MRGIRYGIRNDTDSGDAEGMTLIRSCTTAFRGIRVWVLGLMAVVLAAPAHAYLDPGTGSYLFQLLVGAALGSLMAIKIYWRKIRDGFRKLLGRTDPPEKRDG